MTTQSFPQSQKIGAAWTIVYALLTGFGPGAFRNSDVESVLAIFVLPIACLLAAFTYCRNGGYLAFGTLTLATVTLSIPLQAVDHMPELPTMFSMLTLLVGGPLSLAWGLWRARRAEKALAN